MNITNYIGNTPLVRLKKNDNDSADIYVKIESFNAGHSIKARIAKRMVEEAIKKGQLKSGMTIIEPTGGNTGIGLALMSIIYNLNFVAVVPDNYSKERIDLLRSYSAQVVLSNSNFGNDSHIKKARELQALNPDWICLDQFNNTSCIDAHYYGTGREIIESIIPDAFVASVGSGGTFTGVSKRLKEYNNGIQCYVAQPSGCNILAGKAVRHNIQGVSLGIIPPLLDYSLIDGIVNVEYQNVKKELRSLIKTDGLYLGTSSGANIVAARDVAKKLGRGKSVCTVAPDGGQYYFREIYCD